MKDLQYDENGVKIVDTTIIDRVIEESRKSPRKRSQLCLHTEKSDLIQRMVMALQPGTYMQAHKHENPDKRELFTIYQGEIAVVTFDDCGYIIKSYRLAQDKIRTIELRPRIYHSLISMTPDSVVFETKDGPWESVERDKTFAPWMPAEDSKGALEYLKRLELEIKLTFREE